MATKKPINETTSARVAKIAAKLLRDPSTPRPVKSVAATALTQALRRPPTKAR